jgi:ankyrin repeat protein
VISVFLFALVCFVLPEQDDGLTPLMKACLEGHLDVVDMLLEAGADAKMVNQVRMGFVYFSVTALTSILGAVS